MPWRSPNCGCLVLFFLSSSVQLFGLLGPTGMLCLKTHLRRIGTSFGGCYLIESDNSGVFFTRRLRVKLITNNYPNFGSFGSVASTRPKETSLPSSQAMPFLFKSPHRYMLAQCSQLTQMLRNSFTDTYPQICCFNDLEQPLSRSEPGSGRVSLKALMSISGSFTVLAIIHSYWVN